MSKPQHPQQHTIPVIVRDPRYVAGRATIGQQTSIDIFETLLHEAIKRYGCTTNSTTDTSTASTDDNNDKNVSNSKSSTLIETAPAYYEYGNALLRFAIRQKEQQITDDDDDDDDDGDRKKAVFIDNVTSSSTTTTTSSTREQRETIAAAAERRANELEIIDRSITGSSIGGVVPHAEKAKQQHTLHTDIVVNAENNPNVDNVDATDGDGDDNDDVELALEMMETSWSILDAYRQDLDDQNSNSLGTGTTNVRRNRRNYSSWVIEQIPRVLTGIGDTLAILDRHADAVEAYLRALDHRQAILDKYQRSNSSSIAKPTTTSSASASLITDIDTDLQSQVTLLKYRRQVVEVTVLVVEELLQCGNDQDVITTEGQILLVSKGNVIDYARGYYDRARDELQETVVLLGQIVAMMIPNHNNNNTNTNTNVTTVTKSIDQSVQDEKENICYVATMVMGVGTTLAELDDGDKTSTASTATATKVSPVVPHTQDDEPKKRKRANRTPSTNV